MATPPSVALVATLLDEHAAALALYASQWTSEPDDCVQEALVELARLDDTPEAPVAWLCRVVKRRALNAARSERRRRNRNEEAFRQRLRVGPAAADPAAIAALADGVAQLDELPREAVVLRVWGRMTLAEIGAALGVSTATAGRRYQEGIDQLRALWSANADPEPTLGESR